ncbi:MAG TPA: 4'-phosphopantetheinyl transferase superfamily protein [Fimbriimonadaceae bacterium]|nr:4'-phosphopantetheinyl transferase superfamily protein [Fimbriimonadaceae bacterium]
MIPDPRIVWSASGAKVWQASLAGCDEDSCMALLSPDELRRADRYGEAAFRRRFVVRRALLRKIAGGEADRDPADIAVAVDPGGKPRLIGIPLEISMAFSGDEALFSVSRRGPVGVDIERIDPGFDFAGILADHFSASERKEFAALSAEERRFRFFRAWTRKEACAKALGVGLAVPMSAYEVSAPRADGLRLEVAGRGHLLVFDVPAPLWHAAAVALQEGGQDP